MRIFLIILSVFVFFSCSENISVSDSCDYFDCSLPITDTNSVPPTDNYSAMDLTTQSTTYLQSYKTGSQFYDTYDLLLPIDPNGSFIHTGDALIWNAVALSTMCVLQYDISKNKLNSSYDVSKEMTLLWTAFKNNLILSTGTIIRHPDSTSNTSISRDAITGFLFLGAIAKQYNCTTISNDFGSILSTFISYGKTNKWDFATSSEKSKPSTTVLNDRHMLQATANIYGLSVDVDLLTSIHNHKENMKMMDIIYESRHKCRLGYPDACLRVGNSAVYSTHLTSMTNFIFYIDSKQSTNPVYTNSEIKDMSFYLGRVGGSISAYNWLYVMEYRIINNSVSNNDVANALSSLFPSELPRENNPTKYGCDEFIWQRVTYNRCSNNNTRYIGSDYLLVFALLNSL